MLQCRAAGQPGRFVVTLVLDNNLIFRNTAILNRQCKTHGSRVAVAFPAIAGSCYAPFDGNLTLLRQ